MAGVEGDSSSGRRSCSLSGDSTSGSVFSEGEGLSASLFVGTESGGGVEEEVAVAGERGRGEGEEGAGVISCSVISTGMSVVFVSEEFESRRTFGTNRRAGIYDH
jgi:hypothetical protein